MSAEALNWVKPRRTGGTGRKATLLVVADIANHHGVVYASVDYLAGLLECHRDTVISHLKRLEADGHLERIRRWRIDGAPTSSLTVLGLRCEDRGSMLSATADGENGLKISAHLERAPKSGSSDTESGIPKSGSSDTKSVSTPAQVGISDSTLQPTRQLDPSANAAAREANGFQPFARPSLPVDGEDINELMACLQQLADWAGDQEDRLHRRFASGWIGDADRVRLQLEAEPPAVRLGMVDYLLRAVVAGWHSAGVAKALTGDVTLKARAAAAAAGRGVKSRDERLSEHERLQEQRDEEAEAYYASLRGDDAPEPHFDFEAEAIEDPHPTDDGDAS